MRIKVKDVTLEVRNIDNARLRDLIELQTQSGMNLPQIRQAGAPGSVYTPALLAFLSMRGAGHAFTWDDALDLTNEDISVLVEPGDLRSKEGAGEDPQKPSGASAPDVDDQAESEPAKTAKPRRRTSTS